ncbi:MAG: SGNH/GDSL hydrolase family protein [Alphaproteobacteria bacterium]|nr:SGNH/GDSL hydrolase family protein [Alphaproteobacteria bacterium]
MSELSDNRFERWAASARRHKWRTALAVLAFLFVFENAAAWAFVAKRLMVGQPITDLLIQYYVLTPFKKSFPGEFVFPAEWADLYAGDLDNPRISAAWWIGDPLLGHRSARNVVVTENRWSYRRTNTQGFIITEADAPTYPRTPSPETYRIMVLGGSTVEGNGASGSLNALPAQVLRALKGYLPTAPGTTRFEVINAGVAGYYSVNELLFYMSELRDFHPDLIISYNGWNDLQIQNRLLKSHGLEHPRLVNEDHVDFSRIIADHFSWVATATRFAALSATSTAALLRGSATLDLALRVTRKFVQAVNPQAIPDNYYFDPEAAHRYIDNLLTLNLLAARDGVAHAWFLQPLAGVGEHPPARFLGFDEQAYLDTRPGYAQQRLLFYGAVREHMARLRAEPPAQTFACMADVTDVFAGNPAAVYADGGHLTDEGNRLVAARLISELARCGIIRPQA